MAQMNISENVSNCTVEEVMHFHEVYFSVKEFKEMTSQELITAFSENMTDEAMQAFVASDVKDNPSCNCTIGEGDHEKSINFYKTDSPRNLSENIEWEIEDTEEDMVMFCGWEKLSSSKVWIDDDELNENVLSKAKELHWFHDNGALEGFGYLQLSDALERPPRKDSFWLGGESEGNVVEKVICIVDKENNYYYLDLTKDSECQSDEKQDEFNKIKDSL